MLAVQAYAYLDVGLLSSWLIGGGIGLLFVGIASWFCHVDDRRAAAGFASADELPTAEEFESRFEEIDQDDADPGRPAPHALVENPRHGNSRPEPHSGT